MGLLKRARLAAAAVGMAVVVPFVGTAPAQAGLLDNVVTTTTTTAGSVVCTLLSCPVAPTSTTTTSLDDLRAVLRSDQVSATGAGIDIAVIDSGISPVGPLAAPGKVLNGPDLSFDGRQDNLRYLDALGHGTNMAGIINAVAPDARLVNLKVADAEGKADITQIIAALDWITEHKSADGLNIRVANLSLSYDTPLPAALNALNAAADRAWRAGIVVVSAAGNDGRGDYRLSAPASNPNGIAVGAVDTLGSRLRSNAVIADFSAYGGVERRPDVVGVGARIASLRVPGSKLDVTYPDARRGDDLFRGSGTSQATASITGSVAQLLQLRPSLSPAQVKAMLKSTATAIPRSQLVGGAGLVDLAAATTAHTPTVTPPLVDVAGSGTLTAARNNVTLSVFGTQLPGEVDVAGNVFDAGRRAAFLASGGQTWSGGSWASGSWTSGSWTSGSWTSGSWTSGSWTSGSWTSGSWTSGSWTSGSWTSGSWTSGSWTSGSWTSGSWTGDGWA